MSRRDNVRHAPLPRSRELVLARPLGFGLAVFGAVLLLETSPWLPMLLLVGGVASLMIPREDMQRGAVGGICLGLAFLWFSPTALGEDSGRTPLILLAIAVVHSIFSQASTTRSHAAPIFSLALVALYWFGTVALGSAFQGIELRMGSYLLAAALAVSLLRRRTYVVRIGLGIYALSMSLICWSWLITVALMQLNLPGIERAAVSGETVGRSEFSYLLFLPLTLTASDIHLYSIPRAVGLAGEPGLFAVQCSLAAAAGLVLWRRTPRGVFVAGGCLLGLVGAQSTAGLLALPLAVGLGILTARSYGRHRLALTGVILLTLLSSIPLFLAVIQAKALTNPASLSDRGFDVANGSLRQVAVSSRISLLASYSMDGILVILILVALAILIGASRNSLPACCAMFHMTLVGALSQPISYLIGVWLVAAALVGMSTYLGDNRETKQVLEESDR